MKKGFVGKMFLSFMIPSVFAALGLGIANVADSLVIGIRIGSKGLAAIAITSPIYMIYALFYMGLGIGGSVEFAKLTGAGKKKDAVDIFNMSIQLSVVIGLIFLICGVFFTEQILWILGVRPADGEFYTLAYEYARILLIAAPIFFINTPLFIFVKNDDNPKLSGIGYVVGNVLDVILNFVFVIGLDVGVTGSIWATVIGQFVATAIFTTHFLKKEHVIRLKVVRFQLSKMATVIKTGFASSNQYISQFVFITLANHILIDKMGDMGVAVFDVVLNVSYVAVLFFQAAGDAMQPLSSTFHGERNTVAEKKIFQLSMLYGMLPGICLVGIIAIFAKDICGIFGLSGTEALLLGEEAVRFYCAGAIFAGLNMIASTYYQSVGRYSLTYLITILRGTVLLIFFTVLFGFTDTELFWMLFPATEFGSFIGYMIVKNRKIFQSKEKLPGEDRIYSIMLDNRETNLSRVLEMIEEFCGKFEATPKQSYYVIMTVEEICTTIMDNAFTEENETMYISVTVISEINNDFRLCIRDNALAFNPFDMHLKKAALEDEEEDLGGLGVMMVKSKAKEFYYRRYQGFNTLSILV